jgi:hypothetical protein
VCLLVRQPTVIMWFRPWNIFDSSKACQGSCNWWVTAINQTNSIMYFRAWNVDMWNADSSTACRGSCLHPDRQFATAARARALLDAAVVKLTMST